MDKVVHLAGPTSMQDSLCGRPDGKVLAPLAGDMWLLKNMVTCPECLHRVIPVAKDA